MTATLASVACRMAEDIRASVSAFDATAYELKELRAWAATDETRPDRCAVYCYRSETGVTYAATNGHYMLVRRSGTHREMSLFDIEKLVHDQATPAPGWASVSQFDPFPSKDPQYAVRSINPAYFAKIANVEKVAGKRAASDYAPKSYERAKDVKKMRAALASQASTISIPTDPLAAWHFKLDTKPALWSGIIAPRRP